MTNTVAVLTPDFTVTYPCTTHDDARTEAIRARGNLPLNINTTLLAEITHRDLCESWQSAMALPAAQLGELTKNAATRLGLLLEEECSADTITEVITDAAVVFLLAMRRRGISKVEGIGPCCVTWHGRENEESVAFLRRESPTKAD